MMEDPNSPEDPQASTGHVLRVLSPDELKAGGDDAGTPKGCTHGDKYYRDGDTRNSPGEICTCTNGVWKCVPLLDPTDPWKP